jgi:hypothetical protein
VKLFEVNGTFLYTISGAFDMLHQTVLLPLAVASCVVLSSLPAPAQDRKPPIAEAYLVLGRLAQGETTLKAHLKGNPDDDEARFGLAAVQIVIAVERLTQSLYQHGLGGRAGLMLPPDSLLIPRNPDPKPISYERMREIVGTFQRDVLACEATLAEMRDTDVKLPLHFGRIRLDIDGDGKVAEDEVLWRIYERVNGARIDDASKEFLIVFDKADVHWLRGYCHLLAATCDMVLAYDFRELFERTGHLVFAKVESPYSTITSARLGPDPGVGFDATLIVDAITMIHLINFPLAEEERMPKALEHLEAVIDQSRLSFQAIEAEMDDDHEWIPGPRQTGVIPGARVTREIIAGWHEFLAEAESILSGERLIPFWRADDPRTGVNLRRVFTEPERFDLVLWVQGSGVDPYLEKGEVTSPDTWRRLTRAFGGQFIGFAFWFN